MSDWDNTFSRFLRITAMVSAIIACSVMSVVIVLFIYHVGFDFWKDLIKDHFPATLGLTGAAIVSFAIVIFLRQTEGPIELEGLGIKIKGAAGQVVLWVLCVVTFALCAKLLW
jgi:hypothetical protein